MSDASFCFLSNYLTHHQLPFCLEMVRITKGKFFFVETEPLPQERINLGYKSLGESHEFVIMAYLGKEEKKKAQEIANTSDVVIIGSASDKYIIHRLRRNKLTFRYSERILKKGSYDILRLTKYTVKNIFFRNKKLFYLLSSAYAAKDYYRCGVRKEKMLKWGYFPENKKYVNLNQMIDAKKESSLLWVGRLIEWKHPELAIEVAKKLKSEGYRFTLEIIGSGVLERKIQSLINSYDLKDCVHMLSSMSPENVRFHMEKSKICLITSDFNEGWGAVLNEAMNSGCSVVASHAIGAVPFLIEDGKNGYIYQYTDKERFYHTIKKLLVDPAKSGEIGVNAYRTISDVWNAENAAKRFVFLAEKLLNGNEACLEGKGPCTAAGILDNDWFGL